jgi:hypothetical protein
MGIPGTFHTLTRSDVLIAAIASIIFFIIFNLNFRAASAVDTLPSTLLPVSILDDQDLNLNEFEELFALDPREWKAGFAFGVIQISNDNIISSYPVGGSVMATPIFAFSRAVGILDLANWQSYRLTGKLAASAMVAASAGLLYLCLLIVAGSQNAALMLTIAYALGTAAWSTASQGMWQHGPGMLCLAIALLAMTLLDRTSRPGLAFIAGCALGMAVLCRDLNIIPAIAFTLYMLKHQRSLLIPYGTPLAIFAIWLLQYNYNSYGHFSGGFGAIINSDWHKSRQLNEANLFTLPLLQGLSNTWLSPSKGLLVYSPFLVFGIIGMMIWPKKEHLRLKPYLCIWVILISIALAKNILWWGGTAYGPRYFTEASLALVMLIGSVYRVMPKPLVYIFSGSILLSIAIQAVGAFYAPCGWAESPKLADFSPERHWDWSDPEILRCVHKGWREGPLEFEFLK